jgi:purine-binding chemotaxis protein CheW
MSEEESNEEPVIQWVTFRLAEEKYGINVMQVQEVLRITEIAPVPGAPDEVVGIINLRGNVVTVINTRNRFGMIPIELDDNARIIVLESGEQVIGLLVDSVSEVVDLYDSEIELTPNVGNKESSKYIQGVCSRDGQLLILVDLNQLLREDDENEMELF